MLVVLLFAALIVPRFVNWSNYTAAFEARATEALGHPVRVTGEARVSILPSPSLSFTGVTVGAAGGTPMATVERFDATIELVPLLQGEVRVLSMRLVRPHVTLTADAGGAIDWLRRPSGSDGFDPDRVILERVDIEEGALTYVDARRGVVRNLTDIRANVSARSLAGPWKADGASLTVDGEQIQATLATGRLLDDGAIRVKLDLQPRRLPVDVGFDGMLRVDPARGPLYQGTYQGRIVATAADGAPDLAGWRSEGAFLADFAQIVVDRAVLSHGPPERPLSLAGSLRIDLGDTPRFAAVVEANQIDLDRTLGAGPSEPLDVPGATDRLVATLQAAPRPPIAGNLVVDVPVVVVGGAIVQGFRLDAEIGPSGATVSSLVAELPGRATARLSGQVRAETPAFIGDVGLSVLQPATFAGWWRGQTGSQDLTGRLLSAFELTGRIDLRPGQVSLDGMRTRIGNAEITGSLDWHQRPDRRQLGSDLVADRIDFVQVKALAELLTGRSLDDTSILADDYNVIVKAGEFLVEDIVVRDLVVNVAYTGDVLTVTQLALGDLGGASLRVTQGQIKGLTSADPSGRLEGTFEADDLDGLVRLVSRVAPDSGAARWLAVAAPSLVPAQIHTRMSAPPAPGLRGVRIALDDRRQNNAVGSTVVNELVLDIAADPQDWRSSEIAFDVELTPLDPAAFLRQLGLARVGGFAPDFAAAGQVSVHGDGTPAEGIATTVDADIGGLMARSSGSLRLDDAGHWSYVGDIRDARGDADHVAALFGFAPSDPGRTIEDLIAGDALAAGELAAVVLPTATIAADNERVALAWPQARVGERNVAGDLTWSTVPDLGWRLDGSLALSALDLDWLTALGFGAPLRPTDDPDIPWATTPFGGTALGTVDASLAISAERFAVGDLFDVADARLDVTLDPQRLDLALTGGTLAGGKATGNLTVQNVGGNARLAAVIGLEDAALDAFVWRRGDRPVATGKMAVTANFEATGRSPAGMMTSLTGGGVLEISDGVIRNVNPNAARPIIRESDIGQAFTEESLREALERTLDSGALSFGDATGSFVVAGGTLRSNNLTLKADNIEARGEALIDFNTMQTRADWTLTLEPGDGVVEAAIPEVGLVFDGPLTAPDRSLDVLAFDAYLNMRLEARMLERIELEEAERVEAERLRREVRRHQTVALARRAAAGRATAAADAATNRAERLTGEAQAAREAAAAEQLALAAGQQTVDEAAAVLAAARDDVRRLSAARQAAADDLTAATTARDEAAVVLQQAVAQATATASAVEASTTAAGNATIELDTARAAADAAETARADAEATALAANAALSEAVAADEAAQAALADAETALTEAERLLAEAVAATAEAEARAIASATDLQAANDALAATEAAALEAAAAAEADEARRVELAAVAESSLAALGSAEAVAAEAARRLEDAVALGEQTSTLTTATEAERQAVETMVAAWRRNAEDAAAAATAAETAHEQDLAALEAASAQALASADEQARREQANRDAVAALATAQEMAVANDSETEAHRATTAERQAARDTAAARVDAAQATVESAGVVLAAAQAAAETAAADLATAEDAQTAATAAWQQATDQANSAATRDANDQARNATALAARQEAEALLAAASARVETATEAQAAAEVALADGEARAAAAEVRHTTAIGERDAIATTAEAANVVAGTAGERAAAARDQAATLSADAAMAQRAASTTPAGEIDVAAFFADGTFAPVTVVPPPAEDLPEDPAITPDDQGTGEPVIPPAPKLRPPSQPASP